MTQAEGPAVLPWAEKIERIVGVLRRELEDPDEGTVIGTWLSLEHIAERILVAIGDANE